MTPAETYLDRGDRARQAWADRHLSSAPSLPASEPPSPPAEPEIYRQPIFPPAALRPWARPFLKSRVSKSPRLPLSKPSAP